MKTTNKALMVFVASTVWVGGAGSEIFRNKFILCATENTYCIFKFILHARYDNYHYLAVSLITPVPCATRSRSSVGSFSAFGNFEIIEFVLI